METKYIDEAFLQLQNEIGKIHNHLFLITSILEKEYGRLDEYLNKDLEKEIKKEKKRVVKKEDISEQ